MWYLTSLYHKYQLEEISWHDWHYTNDGPYDSIHLEVGPRSHAGEPAKNGNIGPPHRFLCNDGCGGL